MNVEIPNLEFTFVKDFDTENEIISVDRNREDYRIDIGLILKSIYFPISLNKLYNESKTIKENNLVEVLNQIDNQHIQLITFKEYLWNEVEMCKQGIYNNRQVELLMKINFINKYRSNRIKYYKEIVINEYFAKGNMEIIWILELIERMWMAMNIRRKPYYEKSITYTEISSEMYELNEMLNRVQNNIQNKMLGLSYLTQYLNVQHILKKDRFKLPYFIIREFKKYEYDKDIYGKKKYNSHRIDTKCFAVMSVNNEKYFSLSGVEKEYKQSKKQVDDEKRVTQNFDDFFKKRYSNEYKKINLTKHTRYYINNANKYIKYGYKTPQLKVCGRMFSCSEQKLLSSVINNIIGKVTIYVKYEPCQLCQRFIESVEHYDKKNITIFYGEQREGLSNKSIAKYDSLATEIYKNKARP